MRLRESTSKIIVVVLSLPLGVLICEAASRLILNPADYLSPRVMRDNILGHKVKPNGSGFDEWGFRNKHVPSTADVVALGDSHTYGNPATMDDSWPSVLARATGLQVCSLLIGEIVAEYLQRFGPAGVAQRDR